MTRKVNNEFAASEGTGSILALLPSEAQISRIKFEGPHIVIYTQNPEFFVTNAHILFDIASTIKKRVILRVDPLRRKSEAETRECILDLLKGVADVKTIFFDGAKNEVLLGIKNFHAIYERTPEISRDVMLSTGWKVKFRKFFETGYESTEYIYQTLKVSEEDRGKFLEITGERIFNRPCLSDRMEISLAFLGSAREVGRSSILVKTNDTTLLLDLGINPGARSTLESYPRFDRYELDFKDLDAVIISHAHLDHAGFLPVIYKYGYRGPVYCTEPTLQLMVLLLNDYIKVATANQSYLPFDGKDLREMIKRCIPLPYGAVTDIAPDVKLVFNNAGHILGSAMVHLNFGRGDHNIVYTSDFKFEKTWLLEAAHAGFPRAETVIIESTYGAREDVMPSRAEVENYFIHLINATLSRGGKVVIPSLAVGRAQEIMLILDHYMKNKELIESPVFIEGMIWEATGIHALYNEYLASPLREDVCKSSENPFESEYFVKVSKPEHREEVLRQGPCIILATSGMLEGGPVMRYFEELAPDGKNCILFVSYQINGTLGRRILDGAREVELIDEEGKIKVTEVKAEINKVAGFSGHSDRNQLLRFVSKLKPKIKQVIVNHGERNKVLQLSQTINQLFKIPTYAPSVLETIRIY